MRRPISDDTWGGNSMGKPEPSSRDSFDGYSDGTRILASNTGGGGGRANLDPHARSTRMVRTVRN